MILNHLNLSVTNVQGARMLLENYFGMNAISGTKDTDDFIALKDENGFILTLMEKKQGLAYPKAFHIGFLKRNKEEIIALYSRLKNDRFEVTEPRIYRGKELDLYFNTPYGFTIQVSC